MRSKTLNAEQAFLVSAISETAEGHPGLREQLSPNCAACHFKSGARHLRMMAAAYFLTSALGVRNVIPLLPLWPVISWGMAASGLTGATWYQYMTPAQRDKANRLAADFAQQMYQTGYDVLTKDQSGRILAEIRKRLLGW